MTRISVIHGPNMNLLGERELQVYGRQTLAEVDAMLERHARRLGVQLETFQSNSEGELVDRIQAAAGRCDGILLNPAGYTHTSVAIRDALAAVGLPAIEVHVSNPYAREPFRRRSTVADVVAGRVMGFGAVGYRLALEGLTAILEPGDG